MNSIALNSTKRIALVSAAALAASALAMGIQPAGAVGTSVTFELTGGSIATTTPTGSTDLAASGLTPVLGSVVGAIEDVTVVDGRGDLVATWDTTADISDFTTGAAGAGEVIANSNVTYTAAALLPVVGYVAAVGVPGVAVTGFETAAQTVMSGTAVGANAGSFIPTLTIAIPAGSVAGVYTGTVTHSTS